MFEFRTLLYTVLQLCNMYTGINYENTLMIRLKF